MVKKLLIYPEIMKFNDTYYLYIKIKNTENDEKFCFKLIKEKKLLQELTIPILKRENLYFYKLKRNILDLENGIRLFYEKGGRDYYVETLNLYDCLIIDENQLSYKFIDEMKKEFLNELRGIKEYG